MKKGINDMNQQLPAYLRMQTHAHARPDQSIVCGQVRVTVITPCLIRFEEGAWTDDATLTVTARDLGECTVRTEVLDDRTVICTCFVSGVYLALGTEGSAESEGHNVHA